MKTPSGLVVPLLITVMFSGCSFRRMAMRAADGVIEDLSTALYRQKDPEFARDASASFLLFTDAMLENSPDDPDMLLTAIQGNTAYAMAFYSETAPERAFMFYDKARDYALRLLGRQLHRNLDPTAGIDTWDRLLKRCDTDNVPALYWLGSSWAGWITTHPDSMMAVADLSTVVAIMKRVETLDDAYQDGGVNLFFALYYITQPRAVGFDSEKSLEYFQKAFKASSPGALMPRLLFARYYAVKMFDRELFERTLREIIDAPPATNPELNLMNAIAVQRARKYLDLADDFF